MIKMKLSAVCVLLTLWSPLIISCYSAEDYQADLEEPENLDRARPSVNTEQAEASTSRDVMSTPEECARTCVLGEKPKTCYYHFTVEYYASLTNACTLCQSNSTVSLRADCQCITSDGYETSGMITANRLYPGPAIIVCQDDFVVIDVANQVPGNAITIHWHGIQQRGYQYFDGVPYVTQCPIQEGATFRYQWKADNSGTYFWHAHTGMHKGEGLEGPLVVRRPRSKEAVPDLWDVEDTSHVIFITDIIHDGVSAHYPGNIIRRPGQRPDNFLINGRGQWTDPNSGTTSSTPLSVFVVEQGRRYRFRLINSCSFTCPVMLTIQGHNLTAFETDGLPFEPVVVTSITSFSAERYDFVINANNKPGSYWIQVRGLGECASFKIQQVAILRYTSASEKPTITRPRYDRPLPQGINLNTMNVRCDASTNSTDTMCVNQLQNAEEVPPQIFKAKPDVSLYLPIAFHGFPSGEVFTPETGAGESAALLGNISNVFPVSPLLSQSRDVPTSQLCSAGNLPKNCETISPCLCSHVVEVPLNATVEIVLVDEVHVPGLSHPFHLHGYNYYVMGGGFGTEHNITNISVHQVQELDAAGSIHRREAKPPGKDTFAVPNNGYTVIRFYADNPGYWLFHCHFLFHLLGGMSLVFHVGQQSDLPPVPRGFPECGNFQPGVYRH